MYPSSETERLGVAAGVVVTALLVGALFVGPWRMFAIDTGSTFPLTVLEETSGSPFLVVMVGSLFVGFVTGAAHPYVVTDAEGDEGDAGGEGGAGDGDDEDHGWGDLAMGIFVPPLVFVFLGFLVVMLLPAGESLLAGAVGDAAAQAAVALVMALLFGGLIGTVIAIGIGLPALASVFVGMRVGSAAAPD